MKKNWDIRGLIACALSFSVIIGLAFACVATQSTPETQAPEARASDDSYDRQTMLGSIVEKSIFPSLDKLVAETEALKAHLYQFQVSPDNDALLALQAQWKKTAIARAEAEHLNLDVSMTVHTQIKKWPINAAFIEEFIAEKDQAIDEAFIDSIGSTSKGLTAIEYFIFDPTLSNEEIISKLQAEPRRMAYLIALGENLQNEAEALYAIWSPEGENQAQAFIEADFAGDNLQGSVSILTNELIELAEKITYTKLNYPLKGVYAEAQPHAVESRYAYYSVPLMVANLRGIQGIYQAGFAGYLDFLAFDDREPPLAQAINDQIEATIIALEAIEPNLHDAVTENPEQVEAAIAEAKKLAVLFKVDMANHFGITVTFSDNDGD